MQKKANVSQSKGNFTKGKTNNSSKQRGSKPSSGKSVIPSRGNDPSWYNLEPSITRDAASFAYSLPAGVPISTERDWSPDSGVANAVPGVLALEVTPTVGMAWNPEDPINMAAQQMYSFITHANSRNTSYDAADLMQYFLATAEAYSYVEFLKRVYGVARLFSYDNKYMPDTILRAMHVDADAVRYNMADFRLGINMLITKLATFAVPNTMSIFNRRQFMYQGMYSDTISPKDQIYMFVPGAFYYWDWKNAKLVSLPYKDGMLYNKCVYYGMRGDEKSKGYLYTPKDLIEMGNFMVNAIMHNTDMGTMNGDVLKAYGQNILTVSPIDEQYVIVPSVDVGVLEQFQNATIVTGLKPESLDVVSAYITTGSQEGTSVLESIPEFAGLQKTTASHNENWYQEVSKMAEGSVLGGRHVIQTRNEAPDAPYNMEITRLMAGAVERDISRPANPDEAATVDNRVVLLCGTEVVTGMYIYDSITRDPLYGNNAVLSMDALYGNADLDWLEDILPSLWMKDRVLMAAKSFEYMPTLYRYNAKELTSLQSAAGPRGPVRSPIAASQVTINTTKYTTLENEDLDNMHKVAVMNEFYVPKIAIKK